MSALARIGSGGQIQQPEVADASVYKSTSVLTADKVSLVTATAKTIATLALEAGTYLVWGQVNHVFAAASATKLEAGITSAIDTAPTPVGNTFIGVDGYVIDNISTSTTTEERVSQILPTRIVTVDATKNFYLTVKDTFSAGAIACYGSIKALKLT